MARTDIVTLDTPDGPMRVHVARPSSGAGPWRAIVFCMDALGMRKELIGMGERIADFPAGYVVAMPDLFHRGGDVLDLLPPELPRETKSLFGMFGPSPHGPALRKQWSERFFGPATKPESVKNDVAATLAHLDTMSDVKKGAVGTTGYCMGGNISLRVGAYFADRVLACASFHGGGIGADAPGSPLHEVPRMNEAARVYCAGAIEDNGFTDADKQRLDDALTKAGIAHTIETYPGKHGFAVPGHVVYDAALSERHFAALESLYAQALA